MKEEALKLADELDALHQYVPSEAPAMIRRLVEELEELKQDNEELLKCLTAERKQGEPVAWMSPDGKVSQTEGKLFHIPLYTKPQQWYMVNKDGYVKPLSDEEIKEVEQQVDKQYAEELIYRQDEWVYLFARAIEERHGIK